MKKLAMAICGIAVAACGAADAKTLVAYYSRSGNTAAVAKMIQTATGGDIFEIKTADADYYPAEYTPMTEVAKKEIADGTLPPINDVPDLTQYDTVLIGTPIWW